MREYLRRVFGFAARNFALRTDIGYAIVSMLASAFARGSSKPVGELTTNDVAWYFAIAVGFYALLRLLAAPYFIWKEDQAEIARLEDELDAPERREFESMADRRVALRQELGDQLAKVISIAEMASDPVLLKATYGTDGSELARATARASEIISQLSYDVPLRVASLNLLGLCAAYVDEEGERSELNKRLWEQRKLTFKLLHRTDDIHELMTLAEIENLIEPFGETFNAKGVSSDDTALAELRALIKEKGPQLYAERHAIRRLFAENERPRRRGTGSERRR